MKAKQKLAVAVTATSIPAGSGEIGAVGTAAGDRLLRLV
jgi:hypothetical protein